MQSESQKIKEQLIGVWVPTFNFVPAARPWPRLVFVDGRGYFEDGDYPTIYSVDHFHYQLFAPTVLEITKSTQEYLNDAADGTDHDDSWIIPKHYDLAFHVLGDGLFLEIELCPGPPCQTQYFKTQEPVTVEYAPRWHFA